MTTWLDRVLATPSVGFALKPELYSGHDVYSAARPLFEKWSKEGEVKVRRTEDAIIFETQSGLHFTAASDKFVAEFQYRYELKERPGLLPFIPNLEPKKYSELSDSVIDQAAEFFDHLVNARRRTLIRVGIVASIRIDGESPPPGVALYIKHLERPWGKPLIRCDSNLVALLGENDKTRDQCHHRLSFNQAEEEKKNDLRLVLDWQRVMLSPVELKSQGTARKYLEASSLLALEYFEKFGQGELEYAAD
jgi:hypothetical protein